jgi:hypothetical protein
VAGFELRNFPYSSALWPIALLCGHIQFTVSTNSIETQINRKPFTLNENSSPHSFLASCFDSKSGRWDFNSQKGSFCGELLLRRPLLRNSQRGIPKNSCHESKCRELVRREQRETRFKAARDDPATAQNPVATGLSSSSNCTSLGDQVEPSWATSMIARCHRHAGRRKRLSPRGSRCSVGPKRE